MASLLQERSAEAVSRPLPAQAAPAPVPARKKVSMPPRAVEKRRCSAPISASGQLKKRPCDTLASGAKADYGRFGWVVGKNVREKPETCAARIDPVVRHFCHWRRRGPSAACQQRSQRRHDWHGFQSRARCQTRWYARASLCRCQPMPVQHRPDHLAERALGPEPASRHIRLFRRQPVVQRQRFGRSSATALTPLSRRHDPRASF